MTGVLIKRREDRERETKGRWYGDTDTGRTPRDRRGPDWRDASTCQGTSRVAGSRQKLGGRHGTDSLCQKEPTLQHLDFGFVPPELRQ